jgi:cytochrome P450
MHRNPELFPNPEEFMPERWDTPLKDTFSYVPFHAGPRTCLGKEMVRTSFILLTDLYSKLILTFRDVFFRLWKKLRL